MMRKSPVLLSLVTILVAVPLQASDQPPAEAPALGELEIAQRLPAAAAANQVHLYDPADTWDLEGLPVHGAVEASVTIVEFSDFECPYCSRVGPTLERLLDDFPEDVRVVFVQMPLAFHQNAHPAAQAALAAHAQGMFWPYHDLLFENQRSLDRSDLINYAGQVGLDVGQFTAALDARTYADAVDAQIATATRIGVRGTPNFRINGRVLSGAQPYDQFASIVREEIIAVQALRDSGVGFQEAYAARLEANAEVVPAPPTPPAAAPAEDSFVAVELPEEAAFRGGSDEPLVTIIEFTDYQCPFCQRAHDTIEALLEENPDVRVVVSHHPLNFHDRAEDAALAAIAAEQQGLFWEYHDALFAGGTSSLSESDLEQYAEDIGLDIDAWNAFRNSQEARDRLASDMARSEAVGVTGTPHFVVNGEKIRGAQQLARFQTAVDEGRERAQSVLDSGVDHDELYEALMEDLPTGEEEAEPVEIDTSLAPSLGAYDAPIEFIVFTDLQCPFCVRFAPTALAVTEQNPDVRLVLMHFPLNFHQDADLAAQAAIEAQRQGLFWEFYDATHENGTAVGREVLERIAADIGMDVAALSDALDAGTHAQRVQDEIAAGSAAGVRGTPSWFVNGVFYSGAHPQEYVEDVIENARRGD